MAKILIVEDSQDYLELLYHFLESAGYEVTAVRDGVRAVEAVEQCAYDLVLLDLMLPKMDGYEVCARIRENGNIPVIMLTALGSEEHQMRGYQMQIDEFVTKPVPMPLLIQKVEAVLRRTMKQEQEFRLCFEELVLDVRMHKVTAAGEPVELTLREFEILQELMQHCGEVVTRKSLVAKLWGYDGCDETRIVDTHMKNLRKKLAGCDYIDTVRGVGYQLKKADGKTE
ncbi:MAG: response regulator transcription factor [Eubacterium sp.]|nr:response regulator transcription factor [Eubacterium sp.]